MYSRKQKRARKIAAFFYRARKGETPLFKELTKIQFYEFWELFEHRSDYVFNDDYTGIVYLKSDKFKQHGRIQSL